MKVRYRQEQQAHTFPNRLSCSVCKIGCAQSLPILYANNYFYSMFDITQQEAEKNGFQSLRSIVGQSELATVNSIIQQNIQSRNGYFELEFQAHRHDGTLNIFLLHATYDEQEACIVCAIFDITQRREEEERHRLSNEENRIALKHSRKLISRYNIQTQTASIPQQLAELLDIDRQMGDMPEAFISTGRLSKDSVQDYRNFYGDIEKGIAGGRCILSFCLPNHEAAWYRMDFSTIYGADGNARNAVITYEDITQEREWALAYEKWNQYNGTQRADSIGYFECNLTKDIFDFIDGDLSKMIPAQTRDSFTAVIAYAGDHFLCDMDRQQYLDFFKREHLLENYHNNSRELHFEHRRFRENKELYWTEATIQLFSDPYCGDVKGFVLIKDIDEEKKKQMCLQERSAYDALTGIYNRALTIEKITTILNTETTKKHAFVMVDIDQFKQLNDSLGHCFGDMVLKNVANNLKAVLHKGDVAGRLGGDEFALCFTDIKNEDLFIEKIEFLRASLAKNSYKGIAISGSLGVAFYPQDGKTFDELYCNADVALYKAKTKGRNQYIFFRPTMRFPNKDAAVVQQLEEGILEQAHQREADLYFLAMEYAGIAIMFWNLETGIHYVSPQIKEFKFYKNITGAIETDFLTFQDVHPHDWPKVSRLQREAKKSKASTTFTIRLRKTEGEYRWCKVSTVVHTIKEGKVCRVLVFLQDVDEAQKDKIALRYSSKYDALTGFPNFTNFKVQAEKTLKTAHYKCAGIWYLDLKNFKFLNDLYGYSMGDTVLKHCADVLSKTLQSEECFSRILADRFAMLTLCEDEQACSKRFEQILEGLGNFKEIEKEKFHLEMTAGIYIAFSEGEDYSIDEMIDRATIAQASIKHLSPCRFVFYNSRMRQELFSEQQLEADVVRAFKKKEFCIFLQPKVEVQKNGRIIGAEALVRWKKPGGAMIQPNLFIPLLEKKGLIVALDLFVFEEVCKYLSLRRAKGKPLLCISVNVSRLSVFDFAFKDNYVALKERYQIPDGILELECTETTLVENTMALDTIMHQMREKGFTFSLDDFGTGYSSLNVLKDVSVEVLKLDMLFFRNGFIKKKERAIVNSLIGMAKTLGMSVVAEGVETQEQADVLKEMGCDMIQGFLYGRPQSTLAFDALLEALDKKE